MAKRKKKGRSKGRAKAKKAIAVCKLNKKGHIIKASCHKVVRGKGGGKKKGSRKGSIRSQIMKTYGSGSPITSSPRRFTGTYQHGGLGNGIGRPSFGGGGFTRRRLF